MKIKTTSRLVSHASASRVEVIDQQLSGQVATEHGFVAVCGFAHQLRLEFISGGRIHTRTLTKAAGWWTAQGIVRPAKEFAAEVAGD